MNLLAMAFGSVRMEVYVFLWLILTFETLLFSDYNTYIWITNRSMRFYFHRIIMKCILYVVEYFSFKFINT